MFSTYGIFDHEADHIIALVRQHAPVDQILATPCPACGAELCVAFSEDGSAFEISCKGKPLHLTTCQEIEHPPPWWSGCHEEPADVAWYWREWHAFDESGTLHMKISGWDADDTRWSGQMDCPPDDPDYQLWLWILNESGCTKDLISDSDLEQLRAEYENAK